MDVSNKTIVALLAVALVISIAGTLYSVSELNKLGGTYTFMTGASGANVSEQNGTTAVQLLGTAAIELFGGINWTDGQVNGSYTEGHDFCELVAGTNETVNLSGSGRDFNDTAVATPYHNSTQSAACDPFSNQNAFVLVNTGNTDISNVTVTSSLGDAGWKTTFNSTTANGTYQFHIVERTANVCGLIHSAGAGSWQTFTTSAQQICASNFESSGVNGMEDAIAIEVNATIPEDAEPNTWLDTLTFSATV